MNNLKIYQSSAGSGKTYTLAKEYLKLAFKHPMAFENILAITFTNKATEEMKSRIIEFLKGLSSETKPELKEQLIKEGIKGDIKQLAEITLENILHNYSDFSICTIDSFFNRLLRSFAKELKLQLGYEIELNQKDVLESITKLLLDDIGSDEDLKKYIIEYISSLIDDDKGWNIERQIEKLGDEIFKERYWKKKFTALEKGNKDLSDNREKIKLFIDEVKQIKTSFENYLLDISTRVKSVLKNYNLGIDDFANKKNGVMGFLIINIGEKKYYNVGANVKKALESTDNWYTKTSKKKNDIIKAVDERLFGLLTEAINYIYKEIKKYNTVLELEKTIFTIGIFEDLISKLNDYRINNRKLLQSDVNNILQSLISSENSPFIYEKIGSNYKNLLIDEFQDTSSFQWKNLLPLIINSLSEENQVLIVGDVKQSIYRWRSGNMNLLLKQIYDDLDGFKNMIKTEYLNENRRSKRKIVEFNNNFFEKAKIEISDGIENNELIEKAYKNESLNQSSVNEGGYVNISFIDYEKEEPEKVNEKLEGKVLNIINEIVKDKYLLSDILILVRKNEEMRNISTLLSNNNIEIVSEESLQLINSPKVRLLINTLMYISDNRDKISKTEIVYNHLLYLLKQNIDCEQLFENTEELFLEKLPSEFFKPDELPKIKPILNDLTVYEVCENLIKIFSLNNISDAYLIEFLNVISEYSCVYNSDIPSFLEWWEKNKTNFSIASPVGTNAVKIMTIHKAKGLQSKFVIVPFANWEININGKKDLIWVSSDSDPFNKSSAFLVKATNNISNTLFSEDYNYEYIQTRVDNLNLLYVAFTRAIDRLFVIVPGKYNGDNIGKIIKDVVSGYEEFNDNNYESGLKEVNSEPPGINETEKLKHFISNEWYKKTIIKPKQKRLKIFTDKEFASITNWGVIVHEVLSYMKTKDDIKKAISKVKLAGNILPGDEVILEKQISEFFNIELISDWFSDEWEVKAETDILLNDGNTLRPDRVIIKNQNAIIIDYKTGIEKEGHKNQVTQYADVLKMMGYRDVKKFLLYINEENPGNVKIVEV